MQKQTSIQQSTWPSNRRKFLQVSSAGIAMAGLSAAPQTACAIDPIKRSDAQVRKLSLAAYSLRDYFTGEKAGDKEPKISLYDFIDYCADLGLEGAEPTGYYFPQQVDKAEILKLKRHAHVAGIDISSGAIANNFSMDPAGHDAQLKHVETWINHYADLGAPVIRVFAGKPGKNISEDQAIKNAISGLKKACTLAGERGVILGIENHDFTTKIDRLMQIVEAVDSPWFGINFDSGNLNFSEDPYADMKKIAPYAVNAQIKVKIKQASGHVEADLERVVEILRDANYSGYFVLEYEEDDPYDNIPKYVERLRKAIA